MEKIGGLTLDQEPRVDVVVPLKLWKKLVSECIYSHTSLALKDYECSKCEHKDECKELRKLV